MQNSGSQAEITGAYTICGGWLSTQASPTAIFWHLSDFWEHVCGLEKPTGSLIIIPQHTYQ